MSRTFLGRTRTRALSATLMLAFAAVSVVPSATADDLGDRRGKVRDDIKSAQGDLQESSAAAAAAGKRLLAARAQLASAQTTLSRAQGALSQAKAQASTLAAQLVVAEQRLAAAQAALKAQQAKVAAQRDQIGREAAATVQRPNPELVGLATMLNADDIATLPTGMQAVSNMMQRENELLAAMRTLQGQLDSKRKQVDAARDAVADKKAQAEANVTRTARLEASAKTAQQSVSRLVGQRSAAQAVADKVRGEDQSQLDALEREDARISAMLKARATAARAKAARSGGSGSSGGGASNGNGTLLRPVSGYITSPYGMRRHPIYGYYRLHDGTDFHAPCGTPMKAAGNGEVIARYYQSAWGNRLLVDLGQVRGHHIVVIYNHATSYRVGVGDRVTRGETVGYAGTTGWSTGCHLHFTVMVDGNPENPMNWL